MSNKPWLGEMNAVMRACALARTFGWEPGPSANRDKLKAAIADAEAHALEAAAKVVLKARDDLLGLPHTPATGIVSDALETIAESIRLAKP